MVTNSELTALIFFISLIIKLGSFPFYGWVIPVYVNINNKIFLLFITIISVTTLYIITTIIRKPGIITLLTNSNILFIVIIGSIVIGSIILANQITVKGFLAGSSIINTSIILFGFITSEAILEFTLSVKLYLYTSLYLNIYIMLNIILYIYWLFLNRKPQYIISYNKNKIYINNLYNILLNFKDNYLIGILWILGGFPPFLLFLFKFYFLYYTIWGNSLLLTILILILLNSISLYGYIKIISNLLIQLKRPSASF
jgi:NADH:ubiquinone oxidoreductase subunit 2 (subunit N)